jgi:hypothetical protein
LTHASPVAPTPDLAPPIPADLTPEQGIALWADVMDLCEEFLLAGLRREVGPDGDLQAAYRRWYAEYMEEHDQVLFRMLRELGRREAGNAP